MQKASKAFFNQFILALCSACQIFDLSCNQTHGTLSLSSFKIVKDYFFRDQFQNSAKSLSCGNNTSFFDSNFTGLYVSETKSLSVRSNLTDDCKLSS